MYVNVGFVRKQSRIVLRAGTQGWYLLGERRAVVPMMLRWRAARRWPSGQVKLG